MSLLNYDLAVDQSVDTTSYSWTLYQANRTTLVDLSGSTARMMIRTLPTDPTPLVSLTSSLTASGQLVLGGTAGTVALNLTKAASALLVAQATGALMAKYIYDIYVDFPNGTSAAIVSGNVNVRIAITH